MGPVAGPFNMGSRETSDEYMFSCNSLFGTRDFLDHARLDESASRCGVRGREGARMKKRENEAQLSMYMKHPC